MNVRGLTGSCTRSRHKQQQGKAEYVLHGNAAAQKLTEQRLLQKSKEAIESSGVEYAVLVAESIELMVQTSFCKAERKLRKAISLKPNEAQGYFNPALCMQYLKSHVSAAKLNLEDAEKFEPRFPKRWATAIGRCFGRVVELLDRAPCCP